MQKGICILTVWIICGVYTWGTTMADMDYNNRNQWENLNEHSRDNVGMCAFECLAGPFGVIDMALASNFNQHGWELWEHQ